MNKAFVFYHHDQSTIKIVGVDSYHWVCTIIACMHKQSECYKAHNGHNAYLPQRPKQGLGYQLAEQG